MDNLTHSLVGLTAAKAGLDKLSPGATVLCVLAANSPDIDVVIIPFGDRWTFLQYHRGITHALVGVIGLAVLLPLIFYAIDRLWARFRNETPQTKLKGLMIASFLVSATHPLLDWTNNYGIRFFLPWSQKWSYGDLVYIVDPYMWLILGGAAFLLTARTKFRKGIWGFLAAVLTFLIMASPRSDDLPNPGLIALIWIVALVGFIVLEVIGAREHLGRRIALAAFALVLCYWSGLGFAHARALARGGEAAAKLAGSNGESVARLAAMPRVANPFRWDLVFETDRATYRFDIGVMESMPASNAVRYVKPDPELKRIIGPVLEQRPARVFLGFARFPVMQLSDPGCITRTLVQFADLRYPHDFQVNLPVSCPATRKTDAIGR